MSRSRLESYVHWGLNTIRYEGLHILLWRLLRLAVLPIGELRMLTVYRTDLTRRLLEKDARVEIEVGPASEADIPELVMLYRLRWSSHQQQVIFAEHGIEAAIRERFESGCTCFVARMGSGIVHYNWIFRGSWQADTGVLSIALKDTEALMDDGFTVEEWRGQGVHTAVNCQMRLFLQQTGYQTVYTLVASDNVSSMKALKRLEWELMGRLLSFFPRWSKAIWSVLMQGNLHPFVVHRMRGWAAESTPESAIKAY